MKDLAFVKHCLLLILLRIPASQTHLFVCCIYFKYLTVCTQPSLLFINFALFCSSPPWSVRQKRHLAYIAEFTSDIVHVPGNVHVPVPVYIYAALAVRLYIYSSCLYIYIYIYTILVDC